MCHNCLIMGNPSGAIDATYLPLLQRISNEMRRSVGLSWRPLAGGPLLLEPGPGTGPEPGQEPGPEPGQEPGPDPVAGRTRRGRVTP